MTATERRLIRLNKPEKSNPRMWKVSEKLMPMLNRLPKKSEYVVATKCERAFKQNFRAQRKSIARKLANPRILQITITRSGIGRQPCSTTKQKTSFIS